MKLNWFSLGMLFLIITGCFAQDMELSSFPLSSVKLKESPFYKAQQADLNYILAMDADRLLAPFLIDAGFEPKAPLYPNWENTGLNGHIGGHYLSALSLMYASTGDKELLDRLEYMIDWLGKCQEKNGNGYVGGIPGGQAMWKEIAQGKINADNFSLNHKWVPLYNIHKLYAGLRDAYLIAGNEKARDILVKLTDWCIDLTKDLSDDQVQEMLRSEHGGLNEVFVQVAEITGNDKYLKLAKKFSHKALLNPLLEHKNELTGLHANTQIPKVIGYKEIADYTGDVSWNDASRFFWETVIKDWTVAIGGNSVREHFNPVDNFTEMVKSNQGPETCNTYNMLRLTKLLFLSDPEGKYMDYYERALYNHILSSENPERGGFVYFTPMRPRHYRVYSQPQECFWCCVGSGLENHGKYGEMIYAHGDNDIYVNLFIPSELNWKEKGIKIEQTTLFPFEEKVQVKVNTEKPGKFSLMIRYPGWAKMGEMKLSINGKDEPVQNNPGTYVKLYRKWKDGDLVEITLPMHTSVEYLPDQEPWACVLHGPVVLAAVTDTTDLVGLIADDSRMGHVASGPFYPIDKAPVIVSEEKDFSGSVKKIEGEELAYSVSGLVLPEKYNNLELVPFFSIQDARYVMYFPVTTKEGYKERVRNIKINEEKMLALEAITVDQVATGEQQPEADHNFKGEQTWAGIYLDEYLREARGWFSYDMQDKNREAKILRITYYGKDKDREFDIYVNEILLDHVKLDGSKGEDFYDVDYDLPQNIIDSNTDGHYIVKFVASSRSRAGAVYYIRLLK